MALRKATHQTNNENSRFVAKAHINRPVEDVKRAAFGELGNRPQNLDHIQGNGLKQNGNLGVIKKDPVKRITNVETAKPKPLKRQETIIKNITGKKISTCSISSAKKLTITDPDETSKNEPQMVPEYILDIFKYLRELETKYNVRENFLDAHESTPKMRAVLVNWLVEVQVNFKFCLETLHHCISIIDRYLQENKKVGRSTLQLVGTSALLIACKYEEMYVPSLEDFVYVCDNSFSKRQILHMEIEILKRLDFNLGKPYSIQFLRRYNKIAQALLEHHILGKYILELALLDHELSHISPSIQAAAACCLSLGILNETLDLQKIWTPTLVHYTSYEYRDFRLVIAQFAMLIVLSEKSKYQAVRVKYASGKFAKISKNPKLNGPLVRKLTVGKKVSELY